MSLDLSFVFFFFLMPRLPCSTLFPYTTLFRSIFLNNGDASFAPGPAPLLQTGASPTGVAIADFNQDGLPDMAVTNGGANTFRVFVGLSGGLFSQAFEPPAGPTGSTPTAIVADTFAAGGSPDVAITNNVSGAAGSITILLSPSSLLSYSGTAVSAPSR